MTEIILGGWQSGGIESKKTDPRGRAQMRW